MAKNLTAVGAMRMIQNRRGEIKNEMTQLEHEIKIASLEQELTSLRQAVVDLWEASRDFDNQPRAIRNAIQKHSALIDRARKEVGNNGDS